MEPPPLEGVEHRFVEVDGLRVHVAEAGTGEPLVLLHGWPQHWWAWRELIPPLERDHRVICPDLRGHGWTDAPRGGYEKEQLATDLLGLLDALELERVRMVGHDWGGFAGFLACLRAPERFSHLVALGILHPWPARRPPDPVRLLKATYTAWLSTPVLGPLLTGRLGAVPLLMRAGRSVGAWTDSELAVYSDRFREGGRAGATTSLYRTFLLRELPELIRGAYRDSHLGVPTLLLMGSEDPLFKGDSMRGYEEHADQMRVEWLDGAGHWLPEEAPVQLLERLGAFLNSAP
jgi:pimeloyl-ACP methyl ester carboxylesterase